MLSISDALRKKIRSAAQGATQDAEDLEALRAAYPLLLIPIEDYQDNNPVEIDGVIEFTEVTLNKERRKNPKFAPRENRSYYTYIWVPVDKALELAQASDPTEGSAVTCEPVTRKPFTEMGKTGLLISEALADEDSDLTEDTLLTIAVAILADEEVAEAMEGLSSLGLCSFYSKLAKGKEPAEWEAIEDAASKRVKNPKYRMPAETLLTTPKMQPDPEPDQVQHPLPDFPSRARPTDNSQAGALTRQLFLTLFDSNQEMADFLLANGMRDIRDSVPSPNGSSKNSYVFALVGAMERRGYINGELFNHLVRHNPRRADQVEGAVRLMGLSTRAY